MSVSLEPEPTTEGERALLITITWLETEHEWAACVALIGEARTEFTNVEPTMLLVNNHAGALVAAEWHRGEVAQVATPSRQRSRSRDRHHEKRALTQRL